MCFEVKNDYQKSSLLQVYLGRSKYGGGGVERFLFFGGFRIPPKSFEPSSSEKNFVWAF